MKDIAKDLNVSVVTVSKVLRNHSDISAPTRERVLKRMKELNYQPNWIARSLATRRTYIIGLVVPGLMHSFFAEVAKGIARRVQPKGYHLLISNRRPRSKSLNKSKSERCLYVLIDRMVDGLEANYVGSND